MEVRVRKSMSWFRPCVSVFQFANKNLFFCQSVSVVREVSFQYNTFKVTDSVVRFVEVSGYW